MKKLIKKKVFSHEPMMEMVTLTLLKKRKNCQLEDYIYTLYRRSNNEIKIGYYNNINSLKELLNNQEYEVLDKRPGSKRESDLLKITLKEIGYVDVLSKGCYEYTNRLISHLNFLGWPTGKLTKNIKKSMKF